jgi:hypothetical protein
VLLIMTEVACLAIYVRYRPAIACSSESFHRK